MKQSSLTLFTFTALVAGGFTDLSRRNDICGSRGYDKNTEGYFYGKQGTYAGCLAECQKNSKNCKSFSFGDGECNLYSVPVAGNFIAVSDSPYTFYDACCPVLASSTTTTSRTIYKSSTTKPSTTPAKTSTSSMTTTKSTTKASTTPSKTTTSSSSTTKSTTRPSTTSSAKTTTTTKTTTKTTPKTTKTTTTAAQTPPCPLPTFEVTNFKYINSTHNCDCAASAPDIGDGTGCLSDITGNWCDPRYDLNCTHCGVPVCYTGLPVQPIGYGPPDSVQADISYIGSCFSENPGSVPLREISDGNVVRCSGSSVQWVFDGDSNKANSTAYFSLYYTVFCDGSDAYYYASANGQVPMTCSHDAQGNATCLLTSPTVEIPATSFTLPGSADE